MYFDEIEYLLQNSVNLKKYIPFIIRKIITKVKLNFANRIKNKKIEFGPNILFKFLNLLTNTYHLLEVSTTNQLN